MVVGSLLLILAAVALLVSGLVDGSSQLLVGSIAASLLAAIMPVVGARQSAARSDHRHRQGGGRDAGEAGPVRAPAREQVAAGAPGRPPPDWTAASAASTESIPAVPPQGMPDPEVTTSGPTTAPAAAVGAPPRGVGVPGGSPTDTGPRDDGLRDDDIAGDEDPPDEPVAQRISPAVAAQVARMSAAVLVVDGRPRYHLAGCVHLVGKDSEPLPVAEAVELGFTPCGRCEPDTALLAGAR